MPLKPKRPSTFFTLFSILVAWTISSISFANGLSSSFAKNCSGDQSQVLLSTAVVANDYIDKTVNELKSRQKQNQSLVGHFLTEGSHSRPLRIQRAISTLICAKYRLKQLNYQCTSRMKAGAATLPLIGNQVWINSGWFFEESAAVQIGTLIHEATHKCGTSDATYFNNGPPRDVGPIPWDGIASTYDYWIEVGVCIPGEDC